ncbi:atp-dependent dna helicase q4-like protein [Dermatophagoides farinae]|uniref:DNA 3'-5' helicase n=1 Tax=Dermatophagoides farinae TaxID=6954 RepID=A0A9D4P6K6_DERFA|nr:atp-dependent dna helicase q4-like protein [Dermatophagoides farinae]
MLSSSDNHARTTTTKTLTPTKKVWPTTLNKSCEQISKNSNSNSNVDPSSSSSSSLSPIKIRFNMMQARENIRRFKEQDIREEIEKDPWYHYSLRYRRRRQLEKSKKILQQQQQQQNNENDSNQQGILDDKQSNDVDNELNKFDDDNQYHLDNLNESIKNLLADFDKNLHNDVNSKQNSIENKNKRTIFMLSEENQEQISGSPLKRHRTNVNKSPKKNKFFKCKVANANTDGCNNNQNTRQRKTIDPLLFFDHVKTFDFESTSSDSSILSKQKKKSSDNNKKLIPIEEEEQQQQPSDENDADNEPKQVIKKLTDVSNQCLIGDRNSKNCRKTVVKKKQSTNGNFRKLQMRKKRFYLNRKQSRFQNLKKNKFKQYKANKMNAKFDNKCYKCGSNDHIEEECDNIPSLAVQFDDDSAGDGNLDSSFDESLDLGIKKTINTDHHDVRRIVLHNFMEISPHSIHPQQRDVIGRIICGHSCLFIAPTGFGKSICYQVAAYTYWDFFRSITIVISPLISLMQDQIRNLPKKLRGVCINSNQSERENAAAISDIIENRAQILFLSPECLVNGFYSIPFKSFPKIAFVCIDEAHCIASWSTNFRPSYLQLYETIRTKLNIRAVLALTATATPEMIENICKNLNIDPEKNVVGNTKIAEHLLIAVSKAPTNKMKTLVKLLKEPEFVKCYSIIIYCTRRDDCERVASYIRTSLQFESNFRDTESFAECYHAGLSSQQRRDIQRRFINDQLRIVVATTAFGMGINKRDVCAVIHYDMPKSFENYVQEIGRAGRDLFPALCHLFLDEDYSDLYTLQNFIYANGVDRCNIEKFIHLIYEPCHCRRMAEVFEEITIEDDCNIECPRHPVALPIFATEIETDIKSEVLLTILMMLENKNNDLDIDLDGKPFAIKIHNSFNSICHVANFSEENFIDKLIEKDEILRHADVLLERQRRLTNGKWNRNKNFRFSIADVARLMGKDVWYIRKHLKKLQRKYRRELGIRFSDYSFHFEAAGIFSQIQLNRIIDCVYERMMKFERQELTKLRFTYQKFYQFRLIGSDRKDDEKFLAKYNGLRDFLNDIYFGSRFTAEDIENSLLSLSQNKNNYGLPRMLDMTDEDYAAITYKITEFIRQYFDQGVDSERKICRILTGISSPQYPAHIWGRVRQFWRSLVNVDFELLMNITKKCLHDHRSNN